MKFNYYKEMIVVNYDCKEYLFETIEEAKLYIKSNGLEIDTVTLSDVGFIDKENYSIVQDNETIIIDN